MKIAIGIIVIIICALFSVLFAEKYKEKKFFYHDFKNFNNKILSEVSFKKDNVENIINHMDDSGLFSITAKEYINDNKSFSNKNFFNEEIEYVNNYFKNLGQVDVNTQLDELNSTSDYLKDKYKFYEDEYKKYYKLYIKVGILIGLIAFVLII